MQGIENIEKKISDLDDFSVDLENKKMELTELMNLLKSMMRQYKDFKSLNITTSQGLIELVKGTDMSFKDVLNFFGASEYTNQLAAVIEIALNDTENHIKTMTEELDSIYKRMGTLDRQLKWEKTQRKFLDNKWSVGAEHIFLKEAKEQKRNTDLVHSILTKKRLDDGVVNMRAQ
jgi:hypothetical protein